MGVRVCVCLCACILVGHIRSWELPLPSVLWRFEKKKKTSTKWPPHTYREGPMLNLQDQHLNCTDKQKSTLNYWAISQWTILRGPPFPSDGSPCLKTAPVKGGVGVTQRTNPWHLSILPLCVQEQVETMEKYSKVKVVFCRLAPRKRYWETF